MFNLLDEIAAMPQTETRATFARDTGVILHGVIPMPNSTALFFYAFQGGFVKVMKVPSVPPEVAERECALYRDVGADAPRHGALLVPVSYIALRRTGSGRHTSAGDVITFSGGILMPLFAMTLVSVPPQLVTDVMFDTLATTISYISSRGWIHGDIKPSNIFIASTVAEPYIGDFGSSFRVGATALDKSAWRGGTPDFQIVGIDADAAGGRFDLACLIVSFLSALHVISWGAAVGPWDRLTISAAISRVNSSALRSRLEVALRNVVGDTV